MLTVFTFSKYKSFLILGSEGRVYTNKVWDGDGLVVYLLHSEPDRGQRWSCTITPVLTWMTRGKGNKGMKSGGQGGWEKCEWQSWLHFHFSSSVLAAHGLKNAPRGSLQLTPTVHRSPEHPLSATPCAKPTSQHVLSPGPICGHKYSFPLFLFNFCFLQRATCMWDWIPSYLECIFDTLHWQISSFVHLPSFYKKSKTRVWPLITSEVTEGNGFEYHVGKVMAPLCPSLLLTV